VFGFGLLLIFVGLASEVILITEVGWAVSGIALIISLASSGMKQMFASRIPFELIDKE